MPKVQCLLFAHLVFLKLCWVPKNLFCGFLSERRLSAPLQDSSELCSPASCCLHFRSTFIFCLHHHPLILVSRANQNKWLRKHGIMGVVVFFGKQSWLLLKIFLTWLRQKCWWMRWCFKVWVMSGLVSELLRLFLTLVWKLKWPPTKWNLPLS